MMLASLAMCLYTVPAVAQQSERDSAFALMNAGKNLQAQPILERLAAVDTTDRALFERLGLNLLKLLGTVPDATLRQQQRVRARAALARAAALGSTDAQILALLRGIPEDGGADASFSTSEDVEAAMQEGERAYSAGDYPQALTFYQKALALDPTMYLAALFSGDTFVRSGSVDSVYFWYARATRIDPDRETAWRYWSDVLLKQNQLDEALEKAVEALVAEPYNRVSAHALSAWAQVARVPLSFPWIELAAPATALPRHRRGSRTTASDERGRETTRALAHRSGRRIRMRRATGAASSRRKPRCRRPTAPCRRVPRPSIFSGWTKLGYWTHSYSLRGSTPRLRAITQRTGESTGKR